MEFQNTPKIELHLHLEGAMPPEFARRLADEKNISLEGVFDETGGYAYRDFWHFLEVYEVATQVLTGPEEFARLTKAVLEQSAQHGVVYTEAFISPDFCGGGDVGAWKEYLAAMQQAAAEAEAEHGIKLRGIATPIRHFGPEKAKAAAKCAAETSGDFITGLGIGGDEKAGKLSDFSWSFDCAREAGLQLTAHAGEWGGPESVRDALSLNVERIGHGVRAIEDAELVKELVTRDVTLEVCPGSNVFLGVYPKLADHPLVRLMDAGVNCTVSTDDPPFFHTTMTKEYQDLATVFRFDEQVFLDLNKMAAKAAFCDEDTRAALLKQFT
ncbi:adenosine deaminase [Halocynthiibacter namhaensis]|uniref:adenosine deaminase n=1 Tax=Halocynthiibacter namhaensis TaxID=1290553 RepID=UPI0005791973|nr:adenosine deaminase [Halocynthiibacter namhaensis]